ncbi:MFS transporter [Lactobacillus sp. ESL0680]|uniref:MFS transporter n=1 Tax=Lactobacillus sp. ESL0680 TaxID=2983210 RepID=UPI0023F6A7F7|nr:MFS transporter [Lactobacillus sp. ESL0680]WEV38909.1 MFS transporter [Lactobacillus sp. ESL0680]
MNLDKEYENKKIPFIKKLGFSSYQLASVTETMVNTWQMYYYTTFLGISIVLVTLMFTISKIIGAVLTPIYGYISDRLYQTKFGRKFGRRKSMLILGIPLKCILYILMWIPNMPTYMYFIFFILYYIAQPLLTMPQLTFMSEMTQDSEQRAQLVGFNQAAAAVAGIFASLFITWIFKLLGQNNSMSYFVTAAIYDVIALIMLICFYKSVYERPYDQSTIMETEKQQTEEKGWQKISLVFWNFLSCLRLKSYLLYLGLYLSEQMFRSLWGNINTYFIIFVLLLTPNAVAVSTSAGFIFGILFLIFFMWLTAKTNGPFTYRVGDFATIAVCLAIMALAIFRPAHMTLLFIILTVLLNFAKTGVVNSTQFIFTFIPDIDEMVTGKRREGQYSGVNNTLDVIFSTLETLILGFLLQATGFVEKSHVQSQGTVNALLILYTVVPIILAIIGIIISYFFKLTTTNHQIVIDEIARLRSGGSMADVTPKTKKVVEQLTGFKYENCWGNNNVMTYHKKS